MSLITAHSTEAGVEMMPRRCVVSRAICERAFRLWCAVLLLFAVVVPSAMRDARSAGAAPSTWKTLVSTAFGAGRAGDWPTGSFGAGSVHLARGRLLVSAADGQALTVIPRGSASAADGQITAVVRPGGDGQWQVGVAARWGNLGNGQIRQYACWIDNSGYIGCTRWSPTAGGGRYTTLFNLLGSPIKAGADYTLSLTAQGKALTFAVNGHAVDTVRDAHPLPAGSWGLYVNSRGGAALGAYARVDFRGQAVKAAPAASATPTRTLVRPTATRTPGAHRADTPAPTATPVPASPTRAAPPSSTPVPPTQAPQPTATRVPTVVPPLASPTAAPVSTPGSTGALTGTWMGSYHFTFPPANCYVSVCENIPISVSLSQSDTMISGSETETQTIGDVVYTGTYNWDATMSGSTVTYTATPLRLDPRVDASDWCQKITGTLTYSSLNGFSSMDGEVSCLAIDVNGNQYPDSGHLHLDKKVVQ